MNGVSDQNVICLEQTSPSYSGLKREIVEVVFGTPSKNCSGMGICMVARPYSSFLQRIICPSVLSKATCLNNQTVRFEFHRNDMSSAIIIQRFLDPYFLIEEPFALPVYLARKWSLDRRWAAPGAYPLIYQDNTWYINCKLDFAKPNTDFIIKT